LLRTTNDLFDCTIGATDGPIGRVKDCYFDAETWVIRYLVVDTGTWLSSRKVLVPRSTCRGSMNERSSTTMTTLVIGMGLNRGMTALVLTSLTVAAKGRNSTLPPMQH
jgi:hypothetical protein